MLDNILIATVAQITFVFICPATELTKEFFKKVTSTFVTQIDFVFFISHCIALTRIHTILTCLTMMYRPTFIITILRAVSASVAEVRRQLALGIAGAVAVGGHICRATLVARGISLAPFIAPFPVVKARRGISRLGDGKNEQRQ